MRAAMGWRFSPDDGDLSFRRRRVFRECSVKRDKGVRGSDETGENARTRRVRRACSGVCSSGERIKLFAIELIPTPMVPCLLYRYTLALFPRYSSTLFPFLNFLFP